MRSVERVLVHVQKNTLPIDLQEYYDPPAVSQGNTPTEYAYDLDRNLIRIDRPDNTSIEYYYDRLGRIDSVITPLGVRTYAYHPEKNYLTGITTADNKGLSFDYDGILLTDMTWNGDIQGTVSFGYNSDFRIAQRHVNGYSTGYDYDRDGFLVQAGELALLRDVRNGMLSGSVLADVRDTAEYNRFGELVRYTAWYGASELYDVRYERDDLGRIVEEAETVQGESHTYTYTYNTAGYLTEVLKDGVRNGWYSYDGNGNRTGYEGMHGTASGTYDDQDRMLSYGDASYTYTKNGELLTRTDAAGTTRYDYDALGNLRGVTLPDGTVIEYIIDGRNRRIGKKVNGVLVRSWIYEDRLRPAAELDGAGNVVARYIYGTRMNVPAYMVRNGTTYRLITDHLGSVRLVVNVQTGEVAQRIDYDAYGVVYYNSTPGFTPFGFAGGLYDHHTGLVRFDVRDYDARTGRWTCKDPIGFAGGDVNLYVYVFNDPLNLVDPLGLIETVGFSNTEQEVKKFIDAVAKANGVGVATR
jgi:RHS repeat-associated protein